MKKILFIGLLILLTSNLSAQFYLGGSVGYSMGATPRVNGKEIKSIDGVIETTNIYGSYGEGFSGGLKFGYFFNKHFGLELNVGYFEGFEQKKADVLIGIDGLPVNENIAITTDAFAFPQLIRSTLSLVYETRIGVYGRFGFYFPLGGKTTIEVDDNRIISSDIPAIGKIPLQIETSYIQELKADFSLGFSGAIGYFYSFEKGWRLFTEIEYLGLAINNKDAQYTSYTQTITPFGIGNIPGFPIETTLEDLGEGKNTIYVDIINSTDNYPGNPNFDQTKEVVEFKQSAPFDSIGINIGAVYLFDF